MFLRRAMTSLANLSNRQAPRAGTIEGGNWDLVDVRTGQLITAGTETETGEPMSAEGALAYHAWYRALSLIATKSAAVPKLLHKPSAKSGLEEAPEHNVYALVNRRVNEEQTAFQFWLQMTGHVASRGNGYAAIFRDPIRKAPTELIPLDPDKTYPVRKAGKLWYVCFPFGEQGEGFKELAENILHFKGWGFDGLQGYPIWEIAANEIGLARGERKLAASRFKNSGRPSIILQTDSKLPDKAKNRIRDDWERLHVGLDNAGKTAVLDGGLKATPIALNAEELGQSAAAQMSIVAISNFTGVPVSKLGGPKSSQSQEQEDRAFIADGLDFYLNLEDDETTAKLLTPDEQAKGYVVISDREAILRPDLKTKFEILRIATAGRAILSPNEAREQIDYPPSDEPEAGLLLTPLNMGKGGSANQPKNNLDDPGRPEGDGGAEGEDVEDEQLTAAREAARYALAHAATKMIKRVGLGATASAAKGAGAFMTWLGELKANHAKVFRQEFDAAERIASALSKESRPKRGEAADYLLESLVKDWGNLADIYTPAKLPAASESFYRDQLARLPQQIVNVFLPGETK